VPDDARVFIVDPVALFREGLRLLLIQADFQVLWCSDKPPELSQDLGSAGTAPMLIIGSDVAVAREDIGLVRRLFADLRVVLLVDAPCSVQLAEAMHCGADTVVPRSSSIQSLIYTLRLVREGAAVFPRNVMGSLGADALDVPAVPQPGHHMELGLPDAADEGARAALHSFGLSEREATVMMWLRDGLSNKEIARHMAISEATVKVHVKAILRKARMRNRTQVASWASRNRFAEQWRPTVQLQEDVFAAAPT
jgi:two-component system nitrate/nitrite response regulator NarL